MATLEIFRFVSLIVWLGVGFFRVGAFVRIFRGTARYYDQLGALISAVGFLFAAFALRWFLPDSEAIFLGLYAFSTLLGLSLLRTLYSYEGAAK